MLKSNSVTKFNARSQCSSPKKQKQNIIYNNKVVPLKDSSSTNNIHSMRTVQYQYKVNPNRTKKYNIIKKKQIAMSLNRNSNYLPNNIRIKKQIDNTENIFSCSTMISRSPNYRKYNYNSSLGNISPFYNNYTMNENESDLNFFNSNSNLERFHYINDNPIPNNIASVLNFPINNNNNINNINNTFNKSQFNYLVNKDKNYFQINNNNNYLRTCPKLYRPKFIKNTNSNYKTISNNKEFIQKNLLSHSPKKYNNFKNIKINACSNSKENIYQQGNNNINYKKNNFKKISNYNSNQYITNIKSSLPKIQNYSNKNTTKDFFSNDINDFTFADKIINFGKDLKKVKKFGNYSLHKKIPSENKLTINKDFNINNSNKFNINNINEDDIPPIAQSKNEKISMPSGGNNFSKKKIVLSKLSLNNKPSDYFSQYMFEQINKIRQNPQYFINNLKNAINNIAYDKKGNLYYNGNLKVALCKGKIAFEEAISFLENTKPMEPLIYKKELCVEISKNEKFFQSGDYLRKKINKIIMEGISVRAFWRDIIKDPEINFLLMVVDDNCIRRGAKRKDILNPEMKYIGINSGSIGKSFVCYTVLSDE